MKYDDSGLNNNDTSLAENSEIDTINELNEVIETEISYWEE